LNVIRNKLPIPSPYRNEGHLLEEDIFLYLQDFLFTAVE